MSIRIAALSLLLIPQALFAAEGPNWFINGGLSFVGYEEADSPRSYRLEVDGGTGLNLTGGVRLANGVMFRGGFFGSGHDGGTYCEAGVGCGNFSNDVKLGETRLVVLYAPKLSDTVMLEIGGGLESIRAEVPSLDAESKAGGLVLEGALVFLASEAWRFNVGFALLGLEDDDTNEDVGGGEFKAGATLRLESVELGATLRGVHLESDQPGGGTVESDVGELRLTVGNTFDL